jgi:hypothetical protein
MALRPIFIPAPTGHPFVIRTNVEFQWFPGMSAAQKKRSIASLHLAAARQFGVNRILEISSKSDRKIGVELSAFNLSIPMGRRGARLCVECAYQGSKVFEYGGPYSEIYRLTAREAKRDERLRTSGKLVGFRFFNTEWPLEPPTAFYNWLYINTLVRNVRLAERVLLYSAFTDIEFNPSRSINCQANSAALFVALNLQGLLDHALISRDEFISLVQADHAMERSLVNQTLL